ncbi:MAG: hypothetical protein OXU42_19145 [Deltaproteobacteria bacterium]|nr:hypothetical protein [Deltaproteobacteria bacterium]
MRPILQEALRAECRLLFRTAEESEARHPGAQVPVQIDPAYPVSLQGITFPDEIETVMLLARYRAALEATRDGTSRLLRLREELSERPDPDRWMSADASDLQAVFYWAQALLTALDQQDPLGTVFSVDEDILGVYEYDASGPSYDDRVVNRATIRLYWAVIGLVSEWLGCKVEDLTIVVLAHELSHAYTQLGADIEGRRWSAVKFARLEAAVAEGLAQYYTDRVLRRLASRYPEALSAHEKMLPHQPDIYRTHQNWLEDFTPEAIRRAMLEMRRWNERTLGDLERRLIEARNNLEPGH